MNQTIDAVVIGAGAAGLACAVELGRRGRDVVVLEQGRHVGSSWVNRYDRLRLNTSRWYSQVPGARYPPGTPMFPSRKDVVQYLQHLAERRHIDVRRECPVTHLSREGSGWVSVTSDGCRIPARHVIVATGLYHRPTIPEWPGRERYNGTVLHSSDYHDATPFAGKSSVVVGAGSSGMEIAFDLAQTARLPVHLSVRTPPNILLRSVAGVPGDPIALLLLKFPPSVADAVLARMRRLTVGDLSQFGLPPPSEGAFTRLRRDGTGPAVVDREVLDAIRAERVQVVGGVTAFAEDSVILEDGRQLKVDAVVAATGFAPGLESLVGDLDVLDSRGLPRAEPGKPSLPGLWFVGFRPVPALVHDVARQSRKVSRAIAKDCKRRDTSMAKPAPRQAER